MRAQQPKLSDLRAYYREAVVWGVVERVSAARKIINWYDTKSAFVPAAATPDKRFDKLRELAVSNPAPHEALTAAERIIPIYEQRLLAGVDKDKAPAWKRVVEEIKQREAELRADYEATAAATRAAIEGVSSVVERLTSAFGKCTGFKFAVREQDKPRMLDNNTLFLSVKAAEELKAAGDAGTVLRMVDILARAMSYDTSKAAISSAEYCKHVPQLLTAAELSLSGVTTVKDDGRFTLLKRAKSDKARLVGERYRPHTYQAIVWQRLFEASGAWVSKTELTAGLDTPWPHRIYGHIQNDGHRGGRWHVEVEAKRVRMTNVTVKSNFPEQGEQK